MDKDKEFIDALIELTKAEKIEWKNNWHNDNLCTKSTYSCQYDELIEIHIYLINYKTLTLDQREPQKSRYLTIKTNECSQITFVTDELINEINNYLENKNKRKTDELMDRVIKDAKIITTHICNDQ